MKVWLDDVRVPPKGWLWVKSYDEAVECFQENEGGVLDCSLDHDLGFEEAAQGKNIFDLANYNYNNVALTGYDFVRWIMEHEAWPLKSLGIHSANPVGARNMMGVIERYGPYDWKRQFKACVGEVDWCEVWGVVYER